LYKLIGFSFLTSFKTQNHFSIFPKKQMKVSPIFAFIFLSLSLNSCQEATPPTAIKEPTEVSKFVPNYDEEKVPTYTLADPLTAADGTKITSVKQWKLKRRPELLEMFTDEMFGQVPPQNNTQLKFEITSEVSSVVNGNILRKEVTIHFDENPDGPKIHLLCYLPKGVTAAPAFLGLNFFGNHSIHPDPDITLSKSWMRNSEDMATANNQATEASRGKRSSRWPVELITSKGFALVTAYYGDIDPDYDDEFQNGIHPLFYEKGQNKPKEKEWGSIAAWAWGLSRAMDYLETDPLFNANQIAVFGHSRLGKASLWAGATDERFAIVISNNSGCGGAALSKRVFGEAIVRINTSFPHWFSDSFNQYNNNEANLAFDQHQLLALMAPRPLYVASAQDDQWADPKGEFLSAMHASPVYQLFGLEGLPATEMPEVNQPSVGTIGYHIRTGKHNVTDYDWEQYIAFAKRHLTKVE